MKKVKVFIVGFLALAALGFVLQALGLARREIGRASCRERV